MANRRGRFQNLNASPQDVHAQIAQDFPGLSTEQIREALPEGMVQNLLTQRRQRYGLAVPTVAASSATTGSKEEQQEQEVLTAKAFMKRIHTAADEHFSDRHRTERTLTRPLREAANHIATAISDGALGMLYEVEYGPESEENAPKTLPPQDTVLGIMENHALGVLGIRGIRFSQPERGNGLNVTLYFGDPDDDPVCDQVEILDDGQIALEGTSLGTWFDMNGGSQYGQWFGEYLRLALLDSFTTALPELSNGTTKEDYEQRYMPAAMAALYGESFTPPPRSRPAARSGGGTGRSRGSSGGAGRNTNTPTPPPTPPRPNPTPPPIPPASPQPPTVETTPQSRFIDGNYDAFSGLVEMVDTELSQDDTDFSLDPAVVRKSLDDLRQAIFDDEIELVRGIADDNPEFIIEYTPDDTLVHNIVDRIVIRNSMNAHQFLHQEQGIEDPHTILGFAQQYPIVEFHYTVNETPQVIYGSLRPEIHTEGDFRGVVMHFSLLGLPDIDEDDTVIGPYERNVRSILELLANKVLVSCCGRLNEMDLVPHQPQNGGGQQASSNKRVRVLESHTFDNIPPQVSQHWQFIEDGIRNKPRNGASSASSTSKRRTLRRMPEIGHERFFSKSLYLSPFGEALVHGAGFPRLQVHHTAVQTQLLQAQGVNPIPTIPHLPQSDPIGQQIRFPQYAARSKQPLEHIQKIHEYSIGTQRFIETAENPFDHTAYLQAPQARALGKIQEFIESLYLTNGEDAHAVVFEALQNNLATELPSEDCDVAFIQQHIATLTAQHVIPRFVIDAILRENPHRKLIEELRAAGNDDKQIIEIVTYPDRGDRGMNSVGLFRFHDLVEGHFSGPNALKVSYRTGAARFLQHEQFFKKIAAAAKSFPLEELVDVLTQSPALLPDDIEMSTRGVGFNRLRWEPYAGERAVDKFAEGPMPLVPLQWMINRQAPDVIKEILGTRFAVIDAVVNSDEEAAENPFDHNNADVPEELDPFNDAESPFEIYAERVFAQVNISDVMAATIALRAHAQRDIKILDMRSKAEAWEVLCWQLGTPDEPEYFFSRIPLGMSHKRRDELHNMLRADRRTQDGTVLPSEYDRIVTENQSGIFSKMTQINDHLSEPQLDALVERGILQKTGNTYSVLIQPVASKILIPDVIRGPVQFNGPGEHVTLREHINAQLDQHHDGRVEYIESELAEYERQLAEELDPANDKEMIELYEEEADLLRAALRYEQHCYDHDHGFLQRQRMIGAHVLSKLLHIKAPRWRVN